MDDEMTTKVDQQEQWVKFLTILLAFVGALIAVSGSLLVLIDQAQMPGTPVWPLPALVLIDWAILGVLGFLGVYFGKKTSPTCWQKTVWFATGALIPLVILGAFSIGLFVLVSLLFFLISAILITIQEKLRWRDNLGLLMVGAVCNLGLLLLFIALGNLSIYS